MSTNLEKLKKLISLSPLNIADQKGLVKLFSHAKDDAELEVVVDLFEKGSKYIRIINSVCKAKIKAFKNQDKKMWKEIVLHEYESLKAFSVKNYAKTFNCYN